MIARNTMTAWLFASVASFAWAQAGKAPETKPTDAKAGEVAPAAPDAKKDVPPPSAGAGSAAAPAATTANAGPVVELKTSEGTIKLELDEKAAPVTVKNFLAYVNDKHYDGTVFHRVIDGFMIQGGGFTAEGDKLNEKKTKDPIANEAKNGLKNDRGTIAMARTSDPNSATAQFFINLVNNDRLNYPNPDGHGYAVFGKVVEGLDVVEKIGKAKTGFKSGMADVPVSDIKIISASVAAGKAH
jgi:peptidyl-prolyl cis-trans isomerase A (cyclophilin A)